MRKFLLLVALVWWTGAAPARGAEPGVKPLDILVYKDGDRVHGKLVRREGKTIVFQSDRFGELRVPADAAVIIPAEKTEEIPAAVAAKAGATPPTPAAKMATAVAKKEERAEAEKVSAWEHFSPAVLTAKLREYFGPWHGKLTFSDEMVSDSTNRSTTSVETLLDRKWNSNEIQLKGRYDYSETNSVATTDIMKAEGFIRHDFASGKFLLYHPTLEWNRASFTNGVPSDYLLLQEEFGGGVNLLSSPARKLRVGVSENLFDVWSIPPADPHSSRIVQSAFVETELKMPWRLLLTERAVYYYSFTSSRQGWENHIELTKKFTETLSTGIRHELREGSPDGTSQDYTRLKLLFGLDF